MHDETIFAERVLRAGARGYIMKQAGGKILVQAIRQVLSGQVYVSEKMSARILERVSGGRPQVGNSPVEIPVYWMLEYSKTDVSTTRVGVLEMRNVRTLRLNFPVGSVGPLSDAIPPIRHDWHPSRAALVQPDLLGF